MSQRLSLTNPRILSVTLLGFASSLPLGLTGATLQAWFTEAGLSLMTVGALSLVGLPYIWKFLWSPLLDKIVPPFLGRRRGWIAITQVGLCITLFIFAGMDPKPHAHLMGWIAVLIAFISASQDIAIDAYRTDILHPIERGMGSAYYIFSSRIAGLVSGGLALVMADHLGWQFTYRVMSVLMGLSVLVTYYAPEIPSNIQPAKTLAAAAIEPFKDLLRRPGIGLILAFIVLYKFGDALALTLMSNFLLHQLNFTLTDVGIAYKTFGLISMIVGTMIGGALLPRLGLYRALFIFGVAQAFSNLMFMVLAIVGKNYLLMASSICIESFCGGMSTTALVVLLTALCHAQYSATQFASLSALSAVGRVFLGPIAALMVLHFGWANFYGASFLICFPSLILLMLLRKRVTFHAESMA